jgi:hypothetical protein
VALRVKLLGQSEEQMHRPLKWCAAALCLFGFIGEGAKADFTSGNDLWEWCQGANDSMQDILCTSYIVGAGETFQALQVTKMVSFYCVPEKVQNGPMIDVVKFADTDVTTAWMGPFWAERKLAALLEQELW